jgi:hypothetical protein
MSYRRESGQNFDIAVKRDSLRVSGPRLPPGDVGTGHTIETSHFLL